jgi:serine phosphatase RsbU (regulator of sigma subunit)
VRAFLSIDPAPAAVVGRLDAMYERLHISEMATLAYLLIDSGDRRVRFVLAGHYPPLVVSADGSRHFVAALPQRPLGAGADSRVEASEPLEPDEVLLLYTDGLVERRGEDIGEGLERLARSALAANSGDVVRTRDAVIASCIGSREDDLCLLVLMRTNS